MAAGEKMREIPFQDISQSINNNLEGADQLRIEALSQLLTIRKAKKKQQVRALKRVRQKHGPNHPRNAVLKMKMIQNERMIGELKREEVRVKTVTPEVDKNSWVVYGYVRNRKLEPLAGIVLGLYQADNTFLSKIGTVTTNKRGYFEFRYTSEKKPIDIKEEHFRDVRKQRLTKQFAVCVQVMDKTGKRLFMDKRSLLPRAGAVDFRDIVIPGDIGQDEDKATRYLGNSNTRELHDLQNEQKGCRIKSIRFDHKVNFTSRKEALASGYDYCAYCFGKSKSRR